MNRYSRRYDTFGGFMEDYARRAGYGYGRVAGRNPGAPRMYDSERERHFRTAYRERGGHPRAPRRPRGGDWSFRWPPPPHRPARGFPPHAVHTYDLDYGRQAGGPTTEYSGRAGYPVPGESWEWKGDRGSPGAGGDREINGYAEEYFVGGRSRGPAYRRRRPRRRPRRPPRHWSTAEPPRRGYGAFYG